jgi:hypothetical protein
MAAGGTAENVQVGPGRLWIAPVGTAMPTSASAALDAAFWPLGYTEEGTSVDIEYTSEDVLVAEELDPIMKVNTARAVTLNVQSAEVTRKRLAVAVNLGAEYADSAASIDLPDGSVEAVGVMVVWDSAETATGNDDNIRWVFPKVQNGGTITIARQKAPQKALLPLELGAVKVTDQPIARVFPNADGLV